MRWNDDSLLYGDMHAFAFSPPTSTASVPPVVPALYVGCDGGLGTNTRANDPAFDIESVLVRDSPDQFNSGTVVYDDSHTGAFSNENRGLQSSLVYALACDRDGVAPPYLGCVDTGLAARIGGLSWRGEGGSDCLQIAAALGSDGIKLWKTRTRNYPGLNSGSGYIVVLTDAGQFPVADELAALRGSDPTAPTLLVPYYLSNFALDSSSTCIAGAKLEDRATLGNPPAQPLAVVRIGQDAIADQISQTFSGKGVPVVATNPGAVPETFVCVEDRTQADGTNLYDHRLWRVAAAATLAGAPPMWDEISAGKPSPPLEISSLAIDSSGNIFIMATTSPGHFNSPLFKIPAGGSTWVPVLGTGLPARTLSDGTTLQPFGKIVAHPDPAQPVLYEVYGSQVYKLALGTMSGSPSCDWAVVGDGLPGSPVSDLWIGNLTVPGSTESKTILRAAVRGRGVWESDVTAGSTPSREQDLYLRRNFLDQGWFSQCPDDVPNPYIPTERVYHYQSADVKIDKPQRDSAGNVFYQTDPEGSGIPFSGSSTPLGSISSPISNVLFDMLKDSSQAVPAENAVRVHVQVHNRSRLPANSVSVWALWAKASAGEYEDGWLPPLSSLRGTDAVFSFWDQFQPDGTIVPNLPAGDSSETNVGVSMWKAVGPPIQLDGIDASHPKVASWNWQVPPVRYFTSFLRNVCVTVFVHSQQSPIGESTMDIDEITLRNKQVCLKLLNLVDSTPS